MFQIYHKHDFMLDHFVSKAATEIPYIKRSTCTKFVNVENNCTIRLGIQSAIDVSIQVLVGLMQGDEFNQQHRNNDTFFRPIRVDAQCNIVSGKIQM